MLQNSSVEYLGGCSNCWPGECDLIGVLGIGSISALLQFKGSSESLKILLALVAPLIFWVVRWGWRGFWVTPFRAPEEFARWVLFTSHVSY